MPSCLTTHFQPCDLVGVADKLRTPEQGADTAVWLAVVGKVPDEYNGQFLEGVFGSDGFGRIS